MKPISMTFKNIEGLYEGWKPSHIAYIKSFDWFPDTLAMVCYCQSTEKTTVWPDNSCDFTKVSIVFKNISSLTLNFNGSFMHQVSGLDIIGLHDREMENINFQVEDYENGTINFYCKEIEITEVGTPNKIMS